MSTCISIKPKIKTNFDLFNKIHDFNILPSEYIHPSWLEDTHVFTSELAKLLPLSRRANKWMSRWIIINLCPGYFYDFGSPGLRLALLDRLVLLRLLTLTGLALISNRLIRTVEGQRIRRLIASLGYDAYDFAVKRAPLLIGGLNIPDMRIENDKELDEQAILSGRYLFEKIFSGQAKPLTDRLRLKFSDKIKWDFSPSVNEETRQLCWRLMNKILITEIGPPWTAFFI